MSIFKKREKTPYINLNSSKDCRTNNEVLLIGDESVKLTCYDLENADLFNSFSLQTRNGSQDLSNGIVGSSGTPIMIVDTVTIPASGIRAATSLLYTDHETIGLRQLGLLIIPSGDFNIFNGNISIQGREPSATITSEYSLPVEFEMYLYEVNQIAFPSSGVGAFQDPLNANLIRDISIPVSYLGQTQPYPKLKSNYTIATPPLPIPAAISNRQEIDFGSYHAQTGLGQVTDFKDISWKFNAPFPCKQFGKVYFLMPVLNLISGATTDRTFQSHQEYVLDYTTSGHDYSPNTMQASAILSGTSRYVETDYFQNTIPSGQKNWMALDFNSYVTPNINIVDNPTATKGIFSELNIGAFNTYDGTISESYQGFNTTVPLNAANSFNPATTVLPSTTSVEFGQILSFPSGVNTIYGGYFFSNTYSGMSYYFNTSGSQTEHYKRDGSTYDPSDYSIDYVTTLSRIDSSTGVIASGTYKTTSLTPIANYSGSYVFSNPINDYIDQTNFNLEKIYSLFDNPIAVSGTNNYLFSVKFLNPATNLPITDYGYIDRSAISTVYNNFLMSPFVVGVNDIAMYSGSYVTNQDGSGTIFQQYNPSFATATASAANISLTCGLISIPDNNAITLIYSYRDIQLLNEKIIYGIQDKLYYSTFDNPEKENWTQIWSGAAINNNALWSAITFNDLLFAEQYAQSSGVVWSTSYSGSAYHWGKRPTFEYSVLPAASGTGVSTLTSGTYNVILATSLTSGGFRSSELMASGINVNTGDWINISGISMSAQYPFDLNTQSLSIFVTPVNGAEYFEATLYSGSSLSSVQYPQPVGNDIDNIFIGNINDSGVTGNTVINTLQPPRPESYLTAQIEKPKFKKILQYFNYVIGFGKIDQSDSIFYSEINGPQIWGLDGEYCGRIRLPNNDEAIVAIERFRQYLIIFTANRTYRLEFNATGGIPFSIIPINPNYGAVGPFCTVATDLGVYALSAQGPVFCNGLNTTLIGEEILPWFLELSATDLQFCFALHNIPKSVVTWSLTNDVLNPNYGVSLVFNYKEKSWNIRKGQSWNCGGLIPDTNDFLQVWFGSFLGEVLRDDLNTSDVQVLFNDGNATDLTIPIQMKIETPWMTLKDSNQQKLMRFVSFDAEQSDAQLEVEAYLDYETIPRYTRIMDLNNNNPNKRINLGGTGRLIKLVIKNIGRASKVKINKIRFEYQSLGDRKSSS